MTHSTLTQTEKESVAVLLKEKFNIIENICAKKALKTVFDTMPTPQAFGCENYTDMIIKLRNSEDLELVSAAEFGDLDNPIWQYFTVSDFAENSDNYLLWELDDAFESYKSTIDFVLERLLLDDFN